jgi:hypothetical protein
MAPKRIHTRRNPDPEAIILVFDPEKIVHKRKEMPISLVLCLDRFLSFPKDGLKSIEDLDFDLKFEQTLFITKSESCLNEIIFDEKRFQDLVSATSIKPLVIPNQNHFKFLLQPWQLGFPLLSYLLSYMIFPGNIIKGLSFMMLKEMCQPKKT